MPKDKKEAKRLYDMEYRRKNRELLKKRKKADYENNKEAGSAHQKEYRSRPDIVKRHNEYCRQPEYVANKRVWDIVYRTMKQCGEFWESAVLVNQIEKEIRKRIPKNERLGYTRNVGIATERNKRRRLEEAITKIRSGEAGPEILRFGWIEESKQKLEMELC